MKHSIQILKLKESKTYWISPVSNTNFSVACDSIEVEDPGLLIDSILSEFSQTSPELIPEMRRKLKSWLNSMTEEDLKIGDTARVRDFIYEMF